MSYIRLSDKSITQNIRAEFSNVSLPEILSAEVLAEMGFAEVMRGEIPSYDGPTQQIEESDPILVGGVWTTTWAVSGRPVSDIKAAFKSITEGYLDGIAQAHDYRDIAVMCSYTSSTNAAWKAEGEAANTLRDAAWTKFHEVEASLDAGGAIPTSAEFLAMLPTL